jgi:pSer/pThr/pTyr-binding forkhead associated (FHA) protein
VRVEPGSIVVADLGSTNGTRVNGRAVQSAPLSDGDVVEMGGSRLVFRDPESGQGG